MLPETLLRRLRMLFMAIVCLATVVAGSGCVQRRMTIRSNPPGALVYVDDYQIGSTPVSTDFVYYGTRKIRLVKDGFETLTVRQPFPIPWYEIFPLDFVSENLWPGEIRDERVVDLAMMPAAATPPEEVVVRAEQSRLAAGSMPAPQPAAQAVPGAQAIPMAQPIMVPQAIPAQPPMQFPAPQPAPLQMGPPQPLPPPAPALQPPLQNAPAQGIPSLGVP